jgi:hypothetical protein
MTAQTHSLDDRIAAAFRDGAQSLAVEQLIREAEAEAAASTEAAEQARARALDPALAPAEVAEQRRAMEDVAFRRDRLTVAAARLAERLQELRAAEVDERRRVVYEAAAATRDALAEELRREYPILAEKLVDLVRRLDASDRQIERINTRALPSGAQRLGSAELAARDLRSFVDGTANVPRIAREVRLPAFEFSRRSPYAWPLAD